VPGEFMRAGAFEVGTGDVIKDHVGLEAEEVAEPVVEGHLDLVLGGVELVEGAVPGVELSGMDADPFSLMPVGDEASALAIADEVGLEPAGQAMLTPGGDEPVGHEHEGAVGEGNTSGPPEVLVEDGAEAELVEEGPNHEDRSPGRGIDDLGIKRGGVFWSGVVAEQSLEFGEDVDEEIFATEVGDDALLDLAAVAVGFDDADIFIHGTAGGADFDDSGVHGRNYHDGASESQVEFSGIIR
jgi:hypothetical protein